MPRSRPSFSVAAPELPQVSFQKIEDDLSTPLRGIQDMQARSFGYQEWLDTLNAERQKRLLDKIPYEVFEVVIDRPEKNGQTYPKTGLAFPSDAHAPFAMTWRAKTTMPLCSAMVVMSPCIKVPTINRTHDADVPLGAALDRDNSFKNSKIL
ncbi:hypothetical protein B0H13DRAFT_1920940 [Mycena leptocephala]|nr:hypothetical protein B0H13DRAFT_1920940 [Mycena leptocephala]